MLSAKDLIHFPLRSESFFLFKSKAKRKSGANETASLCFALFADGARRNFLAKIDLQSGAELNSEQYIAKGRGGVKIFFILCWEQRR